ncbi:MAG: hypothetical protein HOI95_03165 [Chromatiales bacterium]|jgi:hypothetical protein|nr:hypothetical protein [Chromatiales bacterium]
MAVTPTTDRPSNVRSVPVLTDPDVGHYPEFSAFLTERFDLTDQPLESPGLLDVGGNIYELIFIGRSGRPFPAGVEIAALVPGLEPMDTGQADKDLWAILEWLIAGVGEPWSVEALRTTGKIYRILPA